jgi:hypothetical protein
MRPAGVTSNVSYVRTLIANIVFIGAPQGLLAAWGDVPVYAHSLELSYLTGLSEYPPPDRLVGRGLFSLVALRGREDLERGDKRDT